MAIKAAVIGGGPGGLTALKTLSENGIDAQLFEAYVHTQLRAAILGQLLI